MCFIQRYVALLKKKKAEQMSPVSGLREHREEINISWVPGRVWEGIAHWLRTALQNQKFANRSFVWPGNTKEARESLGSLASTHFLFTAMEASAQRCG